MVTKGHVNETIGSLLDNSIDPRLSVVGIGGAGCNVVSTLYDSELQGLELVAMNSDKGSLSKARADIKVLLNPKPHKIEHAEEAVENERESICRALETDVLFLVCGLGGFTGTGAAPAVANLASERGTMVISIAIMPFKVESRSEVAEIALQRLKERCHTVLVVDNENLLGFDSLGFNEALAVVNRMIATLIKSVVEHLTSPVLNTFTEEVQMAAQEVGGNTTESVSIDIELPSGVEATPDFKPVGFDDRGFIGFA